MKNVDITIFGAGPAGLSAAAFGLYLGRKVALIEVGNHVDSRTHYNPKDLVSGVGGAGLYSDGKISLYPSASALWQLEDTDALSFGYRRIQSIFSDHITLPNFPKHIKQKRKVNHSITKRNIHLFILILIPVFI